MLGLKLKTFKKKGQAAGAVGAIITLIVGVGVSVLVLIFVGSLGGQTFELIEDDIDAIGNHVVTNDALTLLNHTYVPLDHSFIHTGTLRIFNASETISLNNFTIDYNAGSVYLLQGTELYLNNSAVYANYTWGVEEIGASVKGSIVSGFSALEQTGDFLPIIVLAVVIALVLGIVLGLTFLGGGRGQSGVAL